MTVSNTYVEISVNNLIVAVITQVNHSHTIVFTRTFHRECQSPRDAQHAKCRLWNIANVLTFPFTVLPLLMQFSYTMALLIVLCQ